MAVRTLKWLGGAVLLILLSCPPALACFGPKLFVAAGPQLHDNLLFALVTLYVEEKTGVASNRVEIGAGEDPLQLLGANRADLVLAAAAGPHDDVVLRIAGLPLLVSGPRPREDLQFTTVLPALRKLERLLVAEDLELLAGRVASGQSAMAAARKFLMERRFI